MHETLIKKILNHLEVHGTITSMEAITNYGATRLSAIIFILRERGYNISTIMTEGLNRYGRKVRYAIYKLNK